MSDEPRRRKLTEEDAEYIFDTILTHFEQAAYLGGDPMELQNIAVKIPDLHIDPLSTPFLDLEIVDENHANNSRIFKVILCLSEPGESILLAPEVKIEADADLMFSFGQAVKLKATWKAGILPFVDSMKLFIHSFNTVLKWSYEDQGEDYRFIARWSVEGESRPLWVGNFIVPKRLIKLKV